VLLRKYRKKDNGKDDLTTVIPYLIVLKNYRKEEGLKKFEIRNSRRGPPAVAMLKAAPLPREITRYSQEESQTRIISRGRVYYLFAFSFLW